MFKNYGDFLKTFTEKSEKAVSEGRISYIMLMLLMKEVETIGEISADFDKLTGFMYYYGFDNIDTDTLRKTEETNEKLQKAMNSVIAILDGA